MKRVILILSLVFTTVNVDAQETFYKPHGVHRIHRISSTHQVLASSNAYHAAWILRDYDGGSSLSTVSRIVLGNYDKQGNFISEFEVLPNQHNGFLLGAELIADSLFVFQVNSNLINPKLICFNSAGVKKWETVNSDIYDYFKVKDTVIITVETKDTGTIYERTNLALYSGFNFTLLDTLDVENIKNAYFSSNNNMIIKGLEISEDFIVLFFENEITLESEFLFFDFNLNYVKRIKGNKDVIRFYVWDESVVVRYSMANSNTISLFNEDSTKNWGFTNTFYPPEYKNVTPYKFYKKNEDLLVLFGATRSSPYNSLRQLALLNKTGEVNDTLWLDQADPRIHPANFLKTDDGYFFQTVRSWGNNYEGWICKVDSCFSTNSSDFSINLQNERCFSGITSTEEIESTELNRIGIYPNPVSTTLTIQTESNETLQYTLSNIAGQVLAVGQVNHSNNSINFSQLPSGLYFLTLQSEQGLQTKKIIKN